MNSFKRFILGSTAGLILSANLFAMQNQPAARIKDVINCFAGKNDLYKIQPFSGPVKLIELNEGKQTFCFFGIHKNQQQDVNFVEFKHTLLSKLGLQTKQIIEIVGDSKEFTTTGTEQGRKIIRDICSGNILIEYGYTGHMTNPRTLDVNAFVNECVNFNPELSSHVLGNILAQTYFALTNPAWKCSVSPHICNFVVVFNENGTDGTDFTKFGDDIAMSDFILNPDDGDAIVCLDGGAQSFKQVVNALSRNCKAFLVSGLRVANDEYFSTAEFLKYVYNTFGEGSIPTEENIWEIYYKYRELRKYAFDPKRPDFENKERLFSQAINEFITQGIYKKVKELCTFLN